MQTRAVGLDDGLIRLSAEIEHRQDLSRRSEARAGPLIPTTFRSRLLQFCRLCYNRSRKRSACEREGPMKTKAEILEILRREKPELARRYGLSRLALFGSYAREDQREDSDVDILVEIEPEIGLRFVELADRIEDALGVRTEVVSRRAIKPRYWKIIQEELVDVP
jgi:predicted nucleotidyltransferase